MNTVTTEDVPWDRGTVKVGCIECRAMVPRGDAQAYDRSNRPNHGNPFFTEHYLCDECQFEFTCEVCCEIIFDASFDKRRRICEDCAAQYTKCPGCSKWVDRKYTWQGTYCRDCADSIREELFQIQSEMKRRVTCPE